MLLYTSIYIIAAILFFFTVGIKVGDDNEGHREVNFLERAALCALWPVLIVIAVVGLCTGKAKIKK